MSSTSLTVRVAPETKARIEKIAKATDRSISYYVSRALEKVIKDEEWQIDEIKRRVELADRPDAKWIDHDEIEAWLKTWGTKHEKKTPKCA